VKAYCSQNARIALTFDPKADVFPIGFLHDTSLVEVTALHDLQDTMRCPYPADWLSDAEWSELKPGNSSKLHLLGNSEEKVKNIPFEESENMVCLYNLDLKNFNSNSIPKIIGRAIFNTRKTNNLIEKFLSSLKGLKISTAKPGPDDWTGYAARALLFRLAPKTSTASGTAICVLEKRGDGSKFAKIAGFTSFVQDNYYQSSLSMGDDLVRKRLENGELSFYGAFCVPEALKRHSIVQKC
jgi:hypothetical protein